MIVTIWFNFMLKIIAGRILVFRAIVVLRIKIHILDFNINRFNSIISIVINTSNTQY